MTKYALVGDVGGTNARLALCDIASGEISQAKTYSGLDYPSLEAVIRVYLEEHKVEVKDGCIAIACPITGDWVAMTNHTWAFSIAEMKKNLGFSHLEIINDFTAVSMAIPMLKKEHLIQFGGAEPVEGKPIAVYGAGTGLGVAHLVHVDKRWVSLPGEGGHVDFAPNSEEEAIILEILRAEIGHVSAERSCLWRDGAVRPPVEAGTHRNDSGDSLNVAGIHVLQGVEDVNIGFCQRLNSTPRNKRLRQLIPRTQNQSRPASIHLPLPEMPPPPRLAHAHYAAPDTNCRRWYLTAPDLPASGSNLRAGQPSSR